MEVQPHNHRIILFSSRFRYPNRRLIFSRARLFPDRIELSGWDLKAKVETQIPLRQVREIEWHTDARNAPNVVFRLQDGTDVALHLRHAEQWKYTIEQRLCWSGTHTYSHGATRRALDLPLSDLVSYTSGMA